MPKITPRGHRSAVLLGSLLLLFLLVPFTEALKLSRQPLFVLLVIPLFAGVYAVSLSRARFLGSLLLAVPALAVGAASFAFPENHPLSLVSDVLWVAFFGRVLVLTVGYVFSRKEDVGDTILASISIYILIGILWALLYRITDALAPGALASSAGQALHPRDYIYFSFITLATVGYGDIVPVAPLAKSLAILEAIAGPVFLATFVARLVGWRKD